MSIGTTESLRIFLTQQLMDVEEDIETISSYISCNPPEATGELLKLISLPRPPVASKIKFNVKASIPLDGTFEKWDATLAFTDGVLWFERGDFELGGNIPFVKIADHVELTIDFKATRISGPPLLFKQ